MTVSDDDKGKLDSFSRRVLDFLEQAAPDLVTNFTVEPSDSGSHHVLWLRLQPPNSRLDELVLDTDHEEITWGVYGWHGHYQGQTLEDLRIVLSALQKFLHDDLLAISFYRDGDNWAGSTLAPTLEEAQTGIFADVKGRIEVRSWSGNSDLDM